MKDCLFCKIIKGKIQCYKIFENEKFLIILDAFPSVLGQVLIIPKNHFIGTVFDLKEEFYDEMFLMAKRIAIAIQKALNPIKVGMVVEGLEIEHLHIKLYPLHKEGLSLAPMEKNPTNQEMNETAKIIIRELKHDSN